MIVRTWRGWTSTANAEAYAEYLEATGVSAYRDTAGNAGVQILRRVDGGRAEFLVLSFWESMDAVRRFAGPDPDRAVFYPEDERFLVEADRHVQHYEIVSAAPARPRSDGRS